MEMPVTVRRRSAGGSRLGNDRLRSLVGLLETYPLSPCCVDSKPADASCLKCQCNELEWEKTRWPETEGQLFSLFITRLFAGDCMSVGVFGVTIFLVDFSFLPLFDLLTSRRNCCICSQIRQDTPQSGWSCAVPR